MLQILDKVKTKTGKIGCIVDYSDAHGLCYGVVFPNLNGHYGRQDRLEVFWFDPGEIERTDDVPK